MHTHTECFQVYYTASSSQPPPLPFALHSVPSLNLICISGYRALTQQHHLLVTLYFWQNLRGHRHSDGKKNPRGDLRGCQDHRALR